MSPVEKCRCLKLMLNGPVLKSVISGELYMFSLLLLIYIIGQLVGEEG
jgi:hypothetical protein